MIAVLPSSRLKDGVAINCCKRSTASRNKISFALSFINDRCARTACDQLMQVLGLTDNNFFNTAVQCREGIIHFGQHARKYFLFGFQLLVIIAIEAWYDSSVILSIQ